MVDPISTAALAKLVGVGAGLSVLDKFLSLMQTKDIRRIQSRTLDQMVTFNNDLMRRARGKHTKAEMAQLKRNAEPYVNAVAGNVSARGFGNSPAGVRQITEAQQAPFLASQNAATQAIPGSLQSLMSVINQNLAQLGGDEGIANEFAGLVQSYATLRGLNAMPNPNATGQGYGDAGFVQPGQANAADNQFDLFNLEGSGGF